MNKKTNGFSLPLHPYQIMTWLIVLWHTILPIIAYTVLPSLQVSKIFPIIFYLSQVILIIIGFIVTKSDPSVSLTLTDSK